jgi:hypothetical protein
MSFPSDCGDMQLNSPVAPGFEDFAPIFAVVNSTAPADMAQLHAAFSRVQEFYTEIAKKLISARAESNGACLLLSSIIF